MEEEGERRRSSKSSSASTNPPTHFLSSSPPLPLVGLTILSYNYTTKKRNKQTGKMKKDEEEEGEGKYQLREGRGDGDRRQRFVYSFERHFALPFSIFFSKKKIIDINGYSREGRRTREGELSHSLGLGGDRRGGIVDENAVDETSRRFTRALAHRGKWGRRRS